jgi:hypothetical protein
MNGTNSRVSVGGLILVPAIITLAITILRLVGELQNWSPLFFSKSAGGGGAIVGISWLPVIFGPYFAWKLAAAGDGPSSLGKMFASVVADLVVFVLGGFAFFFGFIRHMNAVSLAGFVLMLVSAFIPRIGWRSFGNALLAYSFAARVPVVIVMFIAMSANGGQGWGTHYDVTTPGFTVTSFAQKFVDLSVLPQMGFWVGYTTVIAAVFGSIFFAIFGRKRSVVAAA